MNHSLLEEGKKERKKTVIIEKEDGIACCLGKVYIFVCGLI